MFRAGAAIILSLVAIKLAAELTLGVSCRLAVRRDLRRQFRQAQA